MQLHPHRLSTQATHRQRRPSATAPRPVRHRGPPSGTYPCKPGGPNDYVYVYTSRANPAHWQRLLEVIGREELNGDPRFDTAAARAGARAGGRRDDRRLDAPARQARGDAACSASAGVPAGAVFDTRS